MSKLAFTVIKIILFVNAKIDDSLESPASCDDAPTEAARIICHQLQKWDVQARALPPVASFAAFMPGLPGKSRMIAAEIAPIASSPYQCMDLSCLCSYLRGRSNPGGSCTLPNGKPLRKALRKEYRTLTDVERQNFHVALRKLKASGEYNKLARIHAEASTSGGAHSGPAFLPWHREFMKRVEIALREIDPDLALPYWDSTLDSRIPSPKDSVMWTDELMGTTDRSGYIVGGSFSDFTRFANSTRFQRNVGAQGSPFKQSDIDYTVNQDRIDGVLSFTAPRRGCQYRANYNALEYTHGSVHIFVGGDMFDPFTSGSDPTFYMHHSFVDYIWEMYRQRKQSRYDRENAYPGDNQLCSSALHFGSALMRPFTPFRNVDGLSNKYTDNMYEFQSRPTCNTNCGNSRFLFCDRSHGQPQCASKIRIGGQCHGFTSGEQACYNGNCVNNLCVQLNQEIPTVQTPPPQVIQTTAAPILPVEANCYNENECCGFWAQRGECARNGAYMNEWCKVACKKCNPSFNPSQECSDFHQNCASWSARGQCTRNRNWMAENCRRSCRKCEMTRIQACGGRDGGGGGGTKEVAKQTTTTKAPAIMHCNSPGCYNENVCCPLWGLQGQCSRSPQFMACNCKVSCGLCIPTDYNYGTCNDYNSKCRYWAGRGECNRNAWMLENCRRSCRSCMDQWDLRLRCRIQSSDNWGGRSGDDFSQPDVEDNSWEQPVWN